MQSYRQKRRQKNAPDLRRSVCGLNLNLRFSCPLSCGIAELVEHNTPNNSYEFNWDNKIEGGFVIAVSSDWTSSRVKKEAHSKN